MDWQSNIYNICKIWKWEILTTNKLEDLKIQGVFVTIKPPKIEVSEIRDISPANDPSPVAKYGFEDPLKMIFAWSMGSPYEYLWIYQRSGRSYTWEDYDIVLALEPWKINDGNLILIAPIGNGNGAAMLYSG